MNYADAGVLAIVAVSALLGLARGIVREALGIAAWIAAAWLAIRLYPLAQPVALRYINSPDLANAAALGLVFIAGLIVFSMVANVLGRAVRLSALGGPDRILGLAYGAARGALIVIAAYIVGGMLMPPERWPEPLRSAVSLPYVVEGARWVALQIPEPYRPGVQPLPPAHPDGAPTGQPAAPAPAPREQTHT